MAKIAKHLIDGKAWDIMTPELQEIITEEDSSLSPSEGREITGAVEGSAREETPREELSMEVVPCSSAHAASSHASEANMSFLVFIGSVS